VSNKAEIMLREQKQEFLAQAVDTGIKYDVELGFALQQLSGNEYAMKIATANPDSLKMAFMNCARIGLSLNPASQLAYLVPRDGKICFDISYMGFMHLAQVSGAIQWGQAELVHEKDTFTRQGIDKAPIHQYNDFDTDRGKIIGVYCVVKTDTGDFLTHTMTIAEVNKIKELAKTKNIWIKHEKEMIKKTCVKQARKYWPRRERLDNAVHYMNTDGGEGIKLETDLEPITDEQIEQIETYYILLKPESQQAFLNWANVESVEQIIQRDFTRVLNGIKAKADHEGA